MISIIYRIWTAGRDDGRVSLPTRIVTSTARAATQRDSTASILLDLFTKNGHCIICGLEHYFLLQNVTVCFLFRVFLSGETKKSDEKRNT